MVFLFDQRRPLPGSIVLSVTLMSVVLLAVACSGGNEPGESTSNAEPTAVATEAADDTGEATPAPADDQPSASETQPSSEDEPEAVVQRQILFFHTEW